MNLFQKRYRAWIVPYVEGTLDARRRAKLEAWLAHDPVLAAEAETERRVSARLREAAALATGDTGNAKSLWPSIQARLEPRRPLVRPLLLVGGLSAATATLIGAALWGPLKPSPPAHDANQVIVAKGGNPSVATVVPPPVRTRIHSVHSRHGGAGKRPAVYHILPIPDSGMRRDKTQPQDLLAVNPSTAPDASASDGMATVPKFAPSSRNFRLTGNEHSGKTSPVPDMMPPDPNVTPETADVSPPSADTAPSSHGEGTATDTPPAAAVTPSDEVGTKPTAAPPRRLRHRRHHGHGTHAPTASGHEGAAPDTTNAGTLGLSAPPPPKVGTKPVD